jgi:membrane fusion protein (multidrug efflux system)
MESLPISPAAKSAGTLVLIGSCVLLAACSKTPPAPPPQQAPQVGVFTVTQQPLGITTELPGRTAAFLVADVRPQVTGLILKRQFVEGADVKEGVSLYQIDPAPYQATLNSAKAALARAKANLLTTGPKVARYKDLVAIEGVSKQDVDDAVAADAQARADVESSSAAVDTAAINLKYTHVDAPISGRIGRSAFTPGALVTSGQTTAMTTVTQLDPIYVDVTQSSTDLLNLKRQMESGKLKKAADGQAKVTLLLADGTKYALPGKLQFSDVTVDEGTGNVTLRALFPNPKGDLLPGMYVRAVLESGVDDNAIVVPQQGVTRNQQGQATALVLNKDNKVEQRVLTTAGTQGDKWRVTAGVAAGDRVIVEGLQKVKPGASAVAVAPSAPAPDTAQAPAAAAASASAAAPAAAK